jgi:putative acetyltransferase
MIRPYKDTDLDDVTSIWYETSRIAHSFIPEEALAVQKEIIINTYIPRAKIWVIEENEFIVGFISLLDNLIGGLFISSGNQGKGFGTQLIEHTKSMVKNTIFVDVYQHNYKAQRFYKKCGFILIDQHLDENTNLILSTMMLIFS